MLYNNHNLTSVFSIDRTLSGATIPSQSGSDSNGNEGVLYIPQISKTRALLSDDLISYPGHDLAGTRAFTVSWP